METALPLELADTAHILRRAFDRRASSLGTTRAQWRVLARLSRQDGQRQIDLADSLDVEPITLCRMIDRLSEAGLVERRADEEDRRARRVFLTPKAQPVIESLRSLASDFFAEVLEGISEQEQARTRSVLGRIRDNVAGGGRVSAAVRENKQ